MFVGNIIEHIRECKKSKKLSLIVCNHRKLLTEFLFEFTNINTQKCP